MTGISWPTFVDAPASFTPELLPAVVGDESPFTGSREVFLRWQKWRFQLDWGNQPYLEALARDAHLARSDGGRVLYQVPVFHYRRARGSRSGSVTLASGIAAGATSWTLTGGTGSLLAGDWVQVLWATDVPYAYQVVSSETAGVIQVRPGARKAYSSGAVVDHLNSVSGGYIKDTMERVTPLGGSRYPVMAHPKYAEPLSVEFTTALRRNP